MSSPAIVLHHPDGGELVISLPAPAVLVGRTLVALAELGWALPHQADGVVSEP